MWYRDWLHTVMIRLLRLAAVVVAIAAVVAIVLPYLWSSGIGLDRTGLSDTYFVVFDVAGAVGLLILAGVAALVLVALARILERLEAIKGRAGGREDAAK